MLTIYLVNPGTQSFVYGEYLSLAMAKVWAGQADLPNTTELWRRYDKEVKDRGGYSKNFQLLSEEQLKGKKNSSYISSWNWHNSSAATLRFFIGWLNADAVKYGGRQVSNIFIIIFPFLYKLTHELSLRLMAFPSAYPHLWSICFRAFPNYRVNPLAPPRSWRSLRKHIFLAPKLPTAQ